MDIWLIILLIISVIIFIIVFFVVFKSWQKFHDKSEDVSIGMNEEEVLEIMEHEPLSIERLKEGSYQWTYQKKEWKGWGMMIMDIGIIFDSTKVVISITRNKHYERANLKKK